MPISKIETDSLASGLVAPSATTATTATTATALTTASGSAPSYSARAWVNFNGTGTVAIRASGNVSSITDSGIGLYTVNFTTAMQDANYSGQLTIGNNQNQWWLDAFATTSVVANVYTGSARVDDAIMQIAIFR